MLQVVFWGVCFSPERTEIWQSHAVTSVRCASLGLSSLPELYSKHDDDDILCESVGSGTLTTVYGSDPFFADVSPSLYHSP